MEKQKLTTTALVKDKLALKALNAVNKALLNTKDEYEFMQRFCEVIVKSHGYLLAWVGVPINDNSKSIKSVAQSGLQKSYLNHIKFSWGDSKWGRGPAGTAFRTGQIQIINEISTDHYYKSWRKTALQYGIHSLISIPIIIDRKKFGVLSIYRSKPNAFEQNEIDFLKILVKNFSFGIRVFNLNRSLQATENQLNIINNLERDAILLLNTNNNIIFFNSATKKLFGYTKTELIGKNIATLFGLSKYAFNKKYLIYQKSNKLKSEILFEELAKKKNGKHFAAEISIIKPRQTPNSEFYFVCVIRNISTRKRLTDSIKHRLFFEKKIEDLALYFSRLPMQNIYPGLMHLVKKLGILLHCDRSYLFLCSADGNITNTHEWHRPGVKSLQSLFQKTSINEFPWFKQKVFSSELVEVKDVNKLPSKAQREKNQWLKYQIRSVLVFPMYDNQNIRFGYIGFDNVHYKKNWTHNDTKLLATLIKVVALGLERRRMLDALSQSADQLQHALIQTLEALGFATEKRDPYTAGHQHRTAYLAGAIAKEMGLTENQILGIKLGAMVHDIGKIYIPAEILNRPGKLTNLEMEIIRTHPQAGYDLVKDITFPWPIAQMILQHHERLNGSGYPLGLKGQEICLEARILSVADVVEAMCTHRPYRPANSIQNAIHEIISNKGTLYDPQIVDICVRLLRKKGFGLKPAFTAALKKNISRPHNIVQLSRMKKTK